MGEPQTRQVPVYVYVYVSGQDLVTDCKMHRVKKLRLPWLSESIHEAHQRHHEVN